MDFRHTGTGRVISTVVLFFFTWTFAGICDVAYAVKNGDNKDKLAIAVKEKSTARKLQEAVDSLEQALADPSLDMKSKKKRLRKVRADIERYAKEIREEFRATEKRLVEAGLLGEILKRHDDFVKHFEENLDTLRRNLEDIDSAVGKDEFKEKVGKALGHLEKVKPPRRHVPLDPDKLPHRAAEPTKKQPRLKKEEFMDDMRAQSKPILVASNGSLAGLLDENSQYMQLALAEGAPTQADLAETVEVKFTSAIQAKAQELGASPKEIYEWVRNNVKFAPTWGSIQGADMCLQTMQCNAFDTASLLIALLRASGIPARYAMGTVEIPMEKVMNWAGGFTDAMAALDFMTSGGIPTRGLAEGGQIKVVQLEHVWVEAWVDYIPSLGARHREGDTWIPLDASFKQYEHKPGMDLYADMSIKGVQYIMDYITDATTSPVPAELESLFQDYVTSPYQFYSKRFFEVVDEKYPDAGTSDILGGWSIEESSKIIVQEFPYLLGTLPYRLKVVGARWSAMPDSYRPKVKFRLDDMLTYDTVLNYTASLADLANRRITLSYIPDSSYDEAVLSQYGSLLNVPPYLINVKPVLKVDGAAVAVGGYPSTLGYEQKFRMHFDLPNLSNDMVTNMVVVGDYSAVAIDYFKTPVDTVAAEMSQLKDNLASPDIDDKLGQLLYNIGVSYFHHMNFEEALYAKNFQMAVVREPSEAMVVAETDTTWMFGYPYDVAEGGMGIDIDRDISKPVPLDGSSQRKKDFQIVSGLGGSAWEDMVLRGFFGVPGISAATTLKKAYSDGVPVHMVDLTNFSTVLPVLNISDDVKSAVLNAVFAGKSVIIAERQVQYGQWSGTCYIVVDPVTGAGGYMIEGGMAGGGTTTPIGHSDDSIFRTVFTRAAVEMLAYSLVGSPYTWGGEGEPLVECGFDCSGFIHYVFNAVYGGRAFPTRRTAAGQYSYCSDMNWLHDVNNGIKGDIIWLPGQGHVGIIFFYSGSNERKVIHASGRPCREGEKGTTPDVPVVCGDYAYIEESICGGFGRVRISSFLSSEDKICRPLP